MIEININILSDSQDAIRTKSNNIHVGVYRGITLLYYSLLYNLALCKKKNKSNIFGSLNYSDIEGNSRADYLTTYE